MVMNPKIGRARATQPLSASRLSVPTSIGYEVHEFLAWEALLLDNRRYGEWSMLLAKDLVYQCPGRVDDERSYFFTLSHLRRQPNPAPQTTALVLMHRCVSNIIVAYGEHAGELAVSSYVLINYSFEGEAGTKVLTVDRRDCLVRSANSLQIRRREIRTARLSPETRELLGPL